MRKSLMSITMLVVSISMLALFVCSSVLHGHHTNSSSTEAVVNYNRYLCTYLKQKTE